MFTVDNAVAANMTLFKPASYDVTKDLAPVARSVGCRW